MGKCEKPQEDLRLVNDKLTIMMKSEQIKLGFDLIADEQKLKNMLEIKTEFSIKVYTDE
jgi:hypothetical protein